MKLDGLHHITMITGDAQRNVDFYADLLGLRLVKKNESLKLPRMHEHLRPQLERTLAPLVNPRAVRQALQA